MSHLHKLAALAALCLMGALAHAGGVTFIDGHAMVPLRTLGETVGATINYNSRHNEFDVTLDYQKSTLRPGYRTARYGREDIDLGARVIVVNGTTYVPVEFLTNVYGYDTRWSDCEADCVIVHPRTQRRIVLQCDAPRYPRVERRYDRYDRDEKYERYECKNRYERNNRHFQCRHGKKHHKHQQSGRGNGRGCR